MYTHMVTDCHPDKISSGIKDLDALTDSLYVGDNVIWEIEAGTSSEVFIKNFIRQASLDKQNIIYISFNKSPQSILQQIDGNLSDGFTLIDCFTAGKGKNDKAFLKFYDSHKKDNVTRIDRPSDIAYVTDVLNSFEDRLPPGARYVFDSLTGMQDLWEDDKNTYKFFTYMCPRLYDLGTVAYWLLEKDAHSQAFKANLRHITQVVLDLYKRKDQLNIKALKLDGRQIREAFKPHQYRIDEEDVRISTARKGLLPDIGSKIRQKRTLRGMSQKELADRVDLSPSFISQMENNQISPSLNSFIQICDALGTSPNEIWGEPGKDDYPWLIRKSKTLSNIMEQDNGLRSYRIFKNGKMSSSVFVVGQNSIVKHHFTEHQGKELIYVLKGSVSVLVSGKEAVLHEGDSVFLKAERPTTWKNEGGDEAELLAVCL